MKTGVPCFTAMQPAAESHRALVEAALKIGAPLFMGGDAWKAEACDGGFHFSDAKRSFDLPMPALLGAHQFGNAGLAIAALSVLPKSLGI